MDEPYRHGEFAKAAMREAWTPERRAAQAERARQRNATPSAETKRRIAEKVASTWTPERRAVQAARMRAKNEERARRKK